MSLERFIRYIREGEPVAPGTPNRPMQQLDQNINYLWQLIQAAELGSTVYARMQTVEETLQAGQPVYLNPTTQRFEAAYATTVTDPETGYLLISEKSSVWGIVAEKHNATLADILLFGYVKTDISAALSSDELNGDGSVPAGMWYLSGASEGKLTRQQPPVSVPVLRTDTSGGVFVSPRFQDFLENHRHYVFDLEMLPAGQVSPPAVGSPHSITSADSSLPGWLPADDPVFEGNAPAGAKFGYNMSQNATLRGVYPPLPLSSACVIMQRPSVWDTGAEHRNYGQQLSDDLLVIDRNGLWWMSDCYDEVPWPTLYGSGNSQNSGDICDPQSRDYRMRLYFTRVNFATDTSVVRSLRSRDNRLRVYCAGKDAEAGTGDLELDLDLQLMQGREDLPGYLTIKQFDADKGVFESGPVAEGVYATSANVLLSSSLQSTDEKGNTLHHGRIGIGVLSQPTQELQSQLVRLDGATEERHPVLYIGFPNDIPTSFVVKFEVPSDVPESSQFQYRARIIGRSAGPLPVLHVSYYTAPRPTDGLNTPISVTQNYLTLTIDTTATLPQPDMAVEAVSEPITVNPGDIVYVKVERHPDEVTDTYSGEMGIMQQLGILTAPAG